MTICKRCETSFGFPGDQTIEHSLGACCEILESKLRAANLQLDEAVSALEQIKKRFMDVLKERGMAAFNYVDGGRMKDIAVEALRRLSAK